MRIFSKKVVISLFVLCFFLTVVPVEVKADLTVVNLSSYRGKKGDVITVSGGAEEATSGGTVKVYWDIASGPDAWLLNTTIGKPDGSWECQITIPEAVAGTHYVWAEDSATASTVRSDGFEVTRLPAITVNPTYGTPGATITVNGYNFTPIAGLDVDVILSLLDGTQVASLVTATTMADGTWTNTFMTPAVPFQNYKIKAVDEYGINATDGFKVGIVAMIINSTSGPAGTIVWLTGIGFADGEFDMRFGDIYEYITGTVVGEAISTTFVVPAVTPGVYDVVVNDTADIEVTTTFTVTDGLAERNALIDLYMSTNGDSWFNNDGWKEPPRDMDGFAMPGTENSWYGVTCNASGNVIELILNENNLTGTIPDLIGDLTNLQRLYLNDNQLSGSIPPVLGNLNNLQDLHLGDNQLTGSIPPVLGNLNSLQNIYLVSNQLTGNIPPELGNLNDLQSLYLSDNQLSGSIPPELGNLNNLQNLALDNNQLTGNIPPVLGNLNNLQNLFLHSNQLTGSIPPELGNLNKLQELFLGDNQLTGSIPPVLGNLNNLQILYLRLNQLSGSIPPELGNLNNLQILSLRLNQLSGSIPPELGNLNNLQNLYLDGNQLEASIPTELQNLTNLTNDSSDFRWNALHTSDDDLRIFLNSKQMGGDWESTQTGAPTGLTTGVPTTTSVPLNWIKITYTGGTGGYKVYYSITPGGPYELFETTATKNVESTTVTDLISATDYYFVLRTVTEPHVNNENTVNSEYSSEISATTARAPNPPTAYIDSISPSKGNEGTSFVFTGHGVDVEGEVEACIWSSNIDGVIGETERLVITDLSVGTHNISFRVMDNDGDWSDIASLELVIQKEWIDPDIIPPLLVGGGLGGGGAAIYVLTKPTPTLKLKNKLRDKRKIENDKQKKEKEKRKKWKGKPNLWVNVEAPIELVKTSSASTLKILNIGSAAATDVRVSASSVKEISFTKKEGSIDKIGMGQSPQLEFPFIVNEGSSKGDYKLTFKLECKETGEQKNRYHLRLIKLGLLSPGENTSASLMGEWLIEKEYHWERIQSPDKLRELYKYDVLITLPGTKTTSQGERNLSRYVSEGQSLLAIGRINTTELGTLKKALGYSAVEYREYQEAPTTLRIKDGSHPISGELESSSEIDIGTVGGDVCVSPVDGGTNVASFELEENGVKVEIPGIVANEYGEGKSVRINLPIQGINEDMDKMLQDILRWLIADVQLENESNNK